MDWAICLLAQWQDLQAVSGAVTLPSCAGLSRASTSCLLVQVKDVAGRDKHGHDQRIFQKHRGLLETHRYAVRLQAYDALLI
jgi:hypothetical protein